MLVNCFSDNFTHITRAIFHARRVAAAEGAEDLHTKQIHSAEQLATSKCQIRIKISNLRVLGVFLEATKRLSLISSFCLRFLIILQLYL